MTKRSRLWSTIVLVLLALTICVGLWGMYTVWGEAALFASPAELSPDLGTLTPIIAVVGSLFKVIALMGIPASITLYIIR